MLPLNISASQTWSFSISINPHRVTCCPPILVFSDTGRCRASRPGGGAANYWHLLQSIKAPSVIVHSRDWLAVATGCNRRAQNFVKLCLRLSMKHSKKSSQRWIGKLYCLLASGMFIETGGLSVRANLKTDVVFGGQIDPSDISDQNKFWTLKLLWSLKIHKVSSIFG